MMSDTSHTNHLTEEQLAIYAEALHRGELKDVPKEIRDHIATCDDCASEALSIADILADDEAEHSRQANHKKRLLPYLAVAASIAILVTVYILVPRQETRENLSQEKPEKVMPDTSIEEKNEAIPEDIPKEMEIAEKERKKEQKEEELLAADYTPDLAMEKLVDRYKSGALRGGEIEIKTPSSFNINKGETAKLAWTNPDNQSLLIELYNNQGERIIEKEVDGNRYTLPSDLEPGLYYWKLMNEDFDLLFCGKITISIPN